MITLWDGNSETDVCYELLVYLGWQSQSDPNRNREALNDHSLVEQSEAVDFLVDREAFCLGITVAEYVMEEYRFWGDILDDPS